MKVQHTVVCKGKMHENGETGSAFMAHFLTPEQEESSGQIGEPVVCDYVFLCGLTKEEWDGLEPGHSYTLTIS